MQLRIARHTERLDEVVAFYRDGIGLVEIGAFRDHAGYDGVFLGIPGTVAHLELTRGGDHGAPTPHAESLLVFYVGNEASRAAIAARLRVSPVAPANPYWAEHGTTFEDPDGFRVVLVPERWAEASDAMSVAIELHRGPRAQLRPLFELAEDSTLELDAYIEAGRVLVATAGGRMLGHVQLVEVAQASDALEIKSLAVDPSAQRRGVGRALVDAAIGLARKDACATLMVATAAADTGNLRFYQRLGFRMSRVERDAFTPETGYPPGLTIDGVALRDRVWFELRL